MNEKLKVIITADVKGLQDACKDASSSVQDVDKKAEKSGNNIKKAFSDIGKAIAIGVTAVSTAVVAISKEVWSLAKEVAAYGDEIDKNSQKVGLSAQSYQKWDYAMNISGTSMADCTVGMKTLTNTFDDAINGSASAREKFERLGLSVDDLAGKSREEIFSEVVTALQNVEDETEKAALANDLFGKSGQNLMPLFNMTEEELAIILGQFDEYGMAISDDAVKASAAFQDSLTKLQFTFNGFKYNLVAQFLPALTDVTDGLAGMMAGVEGADEQFKQGIVNTVQVMADVLPQFLDAGVLLIEAILDGITAALPQLFETITQLLLDIIQLIITTLPTVIDAIIQGVTTLVTEISNALPQITGAIIVGLLQIVNSIVSQLPTFLNAFLKLVLSFVDALLLAIPVIVAALPQLITSIVSFLLESIPILIDAGIELLTSIIEDLPFIITTICNAIPDIVDGIQRTLLDNIPKIIDAGVKLLISLIQNLPFIIQTILTAIPQIITSLVTAILQNIPMIIAAGVELLISLITNLPQIIVTIVKAIPQIIVAIVQAVVAGVGQMAQAGLQLVQGLFNGISNAVGWLYGKIRGWVSSVLSYIKGLFGIASPSKVMAGFGNYLVQGLGEGIEDNTRYATDAMNDLSESVENAFNPVLSVPEVEEPDGIDTKKLDAIKEKIEIDGEYNWIDALANKLLERSTDVNLIVNDKVLAQTTIESINNLTRSTGNLGLIIN